MIVQTFQSLDRYLRSVFFVIVADDAFVVRPYLMEPDAFRMCVMNKGESTTFYHGHPEQLRMLLVQFLLRRKNELEPEKLILIISVICAFHNFLVSTGTIQPGAWIQNIQSLLDLQVNPILTLGGTLDAKDVHFKFTQYFHQEGEVSCEYEVI